jgi:hypothetical protein
MAVTQTHIPTITDAVVELDLSNLGTFTAQNTITVQGELTEVAVSGGDYTTSNLPVLNGKVFSSTGEKQPYEVTVTAVYTEGHSGHTAISGKDLQEALMEAHGDSSIGIRWAPAGDDPGKRRFKLVGVLFRVMPPALQRNGDILYTFALRGDIEDETIS